MFWTVASLNIKVFLISYANWPKYLCISSNASCALPTLLLQNHSLRTQNDPSVSLCSRESAYFFHMV